MRKVLVETPYAGDVEFNVLYARRCMADSLNRNEAPMLSHLLYTQVLDDKIMSQRERGIMAGLAWRTSAEAGIFYLDFGLSDGMRRAHELYTREEIPIETRFLYLQTGIATADELRGTWRNARAIRRAIAAGWVEHPSETDYGGVLMWVGPDGKQTTRCDLHRRFA